MRSTEHLPAGTPSARSLRSLHSSRQRSGAGDRGRSAYKNFNMRTKLLFTFIGMIAGLCLGFTASWVYFDRSSIAIAKNITLLTAEEHIQHAKLLRQGKNSLRPTGEYSSDFLPVVGRLP